MPDQTPAPGPCPIPDCGWDAEGTLDEHLYEHDYNELRPAVVRLALENDRLRAQLADAGRAAEAADIKRATAKAGGMRAASAMLRRHCPDHGASELGTAFMDCHCAGADEIDRDADHLTAASRPTT